MAVTLAGNPIEVGGHFPQAGEMVENFTLVGNDLADVSLNDFAGKRKVLNIFPSIDTGVCATSVRKFNQQAADLNKTVSAEQKGLKMLKRFRLSATTLCMHNWVWIFKLDRLQD